jgi:hypothetical protein
MTVGPHVFGDNRVGLWVASSSNLTDKLAHFLPRLRGAVPNLTDLFLPPEATPAHRTQVLMGGFFCNDYYPPPHGKQPIEYADAALAAFKGGALELNIEGVMDNWLDVFVKAAVDRIRAKKPNLPLRINVVPWKGEFLPSTLFVTDPKLYVIAQSYGGNMEHLYAANDVYRDLTAFGIPPEKASIQHAVMCSQAPGKPRQVTLPQVRFRGSLYLDDLLQDAGLI